MNIRKAVLALAVAGASVLAVPMAASAATTTSAKQASFRTLAATTATSFNRIPVTGKTKGGKAFNGHFSVSRFVTRNGKTYALGTLTGTLGTRHVTKQAAFPATLPASGSTSPLAGSSAVCPILHLTLGPLNLNLLGLTVHLNQVVLDITAQSGPGNLLGNLLCSVANLLNSGSVLSNELSGLLNIVQNLLNTPGLLTL
jgi:hypothetical protein